MKFYEAVARLLGNEDKVKELVKKYAPSGCGFDNGTTLNTDKSNTFRLIFETRFHHTDENGFYDGWTIHTVVVTNDFLGVNVVVKGVNKRNIKDYIYDVFYELQTFEVEI